MTRKRSGPLPRETQLLHLSSSGRSGEPEKSLTRRARGVYLSACTMYWLFGCQPLSSQSKPANSSCLRRGADHDAFGPRRCRWSAASRDPAVATRDSSFLMAMLIAAFIWI
jgi:hypothetical protein